MRILVVGAGAIGGYFGGRLLEAGADVSFLVRPQRAAELTAKGLVIRSALGDFVRQAPPLLLAGDLECRFDVILLSVKAYHLEEAIGSFSPAVGSGTAILPLLNGMRHLEVLQERFGPEPVLGGQCVIAATLDVERRVIHLNRNHELTFGERDGTLSDRVGAIGDIMRGAGFDGRASRQILLEMWEKWVFLAAFAGSACLMRAAIGDIAAAPGGPAMALRLLDECKGIAHAAGFPPRETYIERAGGMLTEKGSAQTASMLRDIENGSPIEADHIVGDLIRRGEKMGSLPRDGSLLRLVYINLKAYEARRERERGPG